MCDKILESSKVLSMTKVAERGKMKKVFKVALTVVTFLSIATGLSAVPAFAADSEVVARSAKGLSSYQVFQSAGSTLTDGQTLATKLRGSDLGVVVIPQKEVETLSVREIASEVRSSPEVEYSTVIVVLDGPQDVMGVSSSNREVEDRVNSYLGNDPVKDAGWVLVQNSSKLFNVEKDLRDEASKKISDAEAAIKAKKDAEVLMVLVPALATIIALLMVGNFLMYRRSLTRNKKDPVRYGFRKMPAGLREAVDSFRKTADLHKNLTGYVRYSLYEDCSRLIARFVELEETMEKLPSTDQRRMVLEVEYVERLRKLQEAIGKDYYLSIIEDQTHWEEPTKKLKRVKDAVIALREQVLVSIKQINDSSNLEFKIALDSIIGDKNVKVEDLYKK
jgi:hypothetical protein